VQPQQVESVEEESRVKEETAPPPPPPSPVESTPTPKPVAVVPPVEMKVMDVRDILSGGATTTPITASPPTETTQQNDDDDDDDEYEYYDEDDEEEEEEEEDEYEETDEYEYYFTDENDNEIIVDSTFGTSLTTAISPSKMDALLGDARAMRDTQPSDAVEDDGAFDVRAVAIQSLSYLVTADFFVVVGLLLWFLVGVFFAKVLGDDSVYLYFAGLFEPVVQPALGILILGAAASAVFKNKEEEDE